MARFEYNHLLMESHLDSTHSSAAQKQGLTLLTKKHQHLMFYFVLILQGSLLGTSAEGEEVFFETLINVPALPFSFCSAVPV